jgi:two-component sensor histidine kinase
MSRLTLESEPIEIDPDRAVAIGIIVNELVMNAVKYAYPDGAGPIHVELKAPGDNIEIAISDDGVGLNVKVDPRSTGMGQRIVSAMASNLEADVERDPAHSGTRIVLRFRRMNATAAPKSASAAAAG